MRQIGSVGCSAYEAPPKPKIRNCEKTMDAKPFDEVGEYLLHAVNEAILALNVDTELDFESLLREVGSKPIS